MAGLEKRYIEAKDAHDAAKAELDEAKRALLEANGLRCCTPCTEDEAACHEQTRLELDAVTITSYARSQETIDRKFLRGLADEVPAVLDAFGYAFRIEARIKVKR